MSSVPLDSDIQRALRKVYPCVLCTRLTTGERVGRPKAYAVAAQHSYENRDVPINNTDIVNNYDFYDIYSTRNEQ